MTRRLTKHARATTHSGDNRKGLMTYHSTNLVVWCAVDIVLDTGGFKTATTKTRMNQASEVYGLDFFVYSAGGEWFVSYKGETILFFKRTLTLSRISPATLSEGK